MAYHLKRAVEGDSIPPEAILASHVKALLREERTPPFGPETPGILLNCQPTVKAGLLKNPGVVTMDDIQKMFEGRWVRDRAPLVTLKYMDGFQYTIGNTYVSRESQGEFIFTDFLLPIPGPSYGRRFPPPPRENVGNYLTFHCKDEGLWVSPHSDIKEGLGRPRTVVSINGNPLVVELKLVFGDVLTISVGKGTTLFLNLLFWIGTSLEQIQPADHQTMDESEGIIVLDIPSVAEKVLGCLPMSRIKDLRPITQLRITEGRQALRSLVVINPFDLAAVCFHADQLMQLSSFINSQLCELKFPHWRVEISRPSGSGNGRENVSSSSRTMKGKKLQDDLVRFFDETENNVKSLLIKGELAADRYEGDLVLFQTLLAGVKDTLTTLDLDMTVYFKSVVPPPLGFQLLRLKSLSMTLSSVMDPIPTVGPFLRMLVPSVASVESLAMESLWCGGDSRTTGPLAVLFLEEVIRLQKEEPTKFVNLKDINISFTEQHFPVIPLASLQAESLTKLELRNVHPGVTDLRPTLLTHACNLETLVIQFRAYRSSHIRLIFPETMPKLRNLAVYVDVSSSVWMPNQVSLSFGAQRAIRRLHYGRRFPSLSKLTIWPTDKPASLGKDFVRKGESVEWRAFLPFIRPFFQSILPVRTIQELDIPFQLRGKYYDVLDKLEFIFPNATFPPELTAARNGPRWDDGGEEEDSHDY